MTPEKTTLEELWARQKISQCDVDYSLWNRQRKSILQMSRFSQSCIFTVDVFKGIYDFASESFADVFGFQSSSLKRIEKQGDLLEERIHPDDREQLLDMQIQHSKFIYSLPVENRNDYSQAFQFRMLNRKQQYMNVISRQRVLQKDRNGKAWIIMGMMDIAPDQVPTEMVKWSVLNLKTGDVFNPAISMKPDKQLTAREVEILHLIRQGLLSKEIACKLGVSIYTVSNHRKSILAKLEVDNAIEAINYARDIGII